jgi:hypothetical protein
MTNNMFTHQQALTGNILVSDTNEVYIRMCSNGDGLDNVWYKLDPLTSNLVYLEIEQHDKLNAAYINSKRGY